MVFEIDTRPKSGIFPKIGSDSRVVAVISGKTAPKYWHKRTCAKCDRSLSAGRDFPSVALNRRNDIMVYHDYCRDCRASIKAEWKRDPLFSLELEKFWQKYIPGLRAGAYGRSILVAIDYEDLVDIYLRQRGCCAISGLELDFTAKGRVGRANRAYLRPSIDRIDSNGNYTLGNIHVVAQVINLMKGALPQSTFVEICGAVSRHNFSL